MFYDGGPLLYRLDAVEHQHAESYIVKLNSLYGSISHLLYWTLAHVFSTASLVST